MLFGRLKCRYAMLAQSPKALTLRYSLHVATLCLRFSGDGELGAFMLACLLGVELEGALLALAKELEQNGLGGMGGVGGSLSF